jgi:IPT/TIG domain-containing protein
MKSIASSVMSRGALRVAALALALGFAAAVAAFAAPGASAMCNPSNPCVTDPPPPPPPPPTVTTITGVSPSSGWLGDTVTISGACLNGASVSFGGVSAPIVSLTSTRIVTTVPAITNLPAGPMQVPLVISGSCGTASTTFTLSGALHASGGATFGVNAKFGQGEDGSAGGTIDLDRASGIAVSHLGITNTQWWFSLSVSESVALLDGSGTVIGFTTPFTATASGVMFSWPSGVSTASADKTEGLSPSMTQRVRSATVLLVQDGASALQSTLANAVALGQKLATVLSALGIV